jgi:hypothetical protein
MTFKRANHRRNGNLSDSSLVMFGYVSPVWTLPAMVPSSSGVRKTRCQYVPRTRTSACVQNMKIGTVKAETIKKKRKENSIEKEVNLRHFHKKCNFFSS